MQQTFNLNWFGMLTIKNIEEICRLLEELLKDKKYTFVAANEHGRFVPEVRTGQQLKPGISGKLINFWYGDNKEFAGFNVGDTYGSWGCSTNLVEDKYDPDFKNPYFVFEYNKVTITHRAGAGNLLYWTIAVE